MAANPQHRLTFAEYLAIERNAEIKSEFVAGEMFLMAGASTNHNRIVRNVLRTLSNQTLEGDCEVYPSDMRVKIEKLNQGRYPDISIVCGEQLFADEQKDSLLNPTVIIEVLSESTELYDRGKKFQDYQSLDSLREYLLIAQTPYCIEQFIKQAENIWTYKKFTNPDDIVQFESTDCTLLLKDVYLKVA
ncbi:MAG: Uma2 family endonuclease [Acidobacteriota bacterium]